MPNQEVISNILDLLEIMEEGLDYIKQRIMELNIEATTTVLSDTIAGFASIEEAITPILSELEENKILEKAEKLKDRFNILVKEYENKDGRNYYEIIQLSLEPAFNNWKKEIEIAIRPYIAS